MSGRRFPRGDAGFTLIEVMVAMTLLSIGVLGAVALADNANTTTSTTQRREAAVNLARELVDAARSVPYDQLTPASLVSQLQTQPGLGNYGHGSGWTIQRRNVAYTITATVCSLDNPADGTGTHSSGTFCSDSAGPGTTDAEPDDEKRITIDVQWTSPTGLSKDVKQVTLLVNPGNPSGPAVTSLQPSPASPVSQAGGSPPPALAPSPATVTFSVTTNLPASRVAWSVNGRPSGDATGSGTSWSFTWTVANVLDGNYTVSAKAYDANGSSAGAKSLTYVLQRQPPEIPSGFVAGRNGSIVEFEWLPNPEGDIAGYKVYRVGSPNVVVCSLTTQTSCQDSSPPNLPLVQYYMTAVDNDGGSPQETASPIANVTQTNQAPNPPTGLSASSSGGVTTLTWSAPNPADADGDSIAFYRIYRDGTAIADRYDRTTGDGTSWVDTNTGGVPHTYWVTAVDPQLAESPFAGPVTQ